MLKVCPCKVIYEGNAFSCACPECEQAFASLGDIFDALSEEDLEALELAEEDDCDG